MTSQLRCEEDRRALEQPRANRHFRIKSVSREKIIMPSEAMSARGRRKGVKEQSKRIFSESRNKKSGSIDTSIKLRITREQLQRKFEKVKNNSAQRKMIVYQQVRTESYQQVQQNRFSGRVRTICHDQNINTLQKIGRICDPNKLVNGQRMENSSKASFSSNGFKKMKNDKQMREPKGKYRCRVNQFVFDHVRKRPSLKKEQETIDEFWKNVNQSLILAGREEEEISKDLKEFVQNFTTE